MELIKINVPNAMMVPIDPYKTLYLSKLFRNAEKPNVVRMLKNVAIILPGVINRHLLCIDGAYL